MEERLQQIADEGYEFEFGTYFSEGWQLFKSGAGSFIGFTIVMFIISYAVSLIFSLITTPLYMGGLAAQDFDGDFSGLLTGLVVGMTVQNVVVTIVQWCLVGGIYMFCRNLLMKKEDFGTFFSGFKHIKEIATFYFFWLLIFLPLMILLFTSIFPIDFLVAMATQDFQEMQYAMEDFIATIAARLPLFFLIWLLVMAAYILFSLTLAIIADGGISAWKAMGISRRIVAKKFLPFFGMYLVCGLILMGGMLVCFVGLLVAFPYVMCIQFTAYNRILTPEAAIGDGNQIDQFGETDSDVNTESEES